MSRDGVAEPLSGDGDLLFDGELILIAKISDKSG